MIVIEKRIHQFFIISVLLKGAHAVIECLGGILLAIVSTETIAWFVNAITQEELVEDPRDFVANQLRAYAQHFSVDSKDFYAFYLLTHKVVKVFLVWGLLTNKLWAYPTSLAVLGLFILYQIYSYYYTHSLGLIALTILDLIVIWLIWHEYRLMRHHRPVRQSGPQKS